MKKLQFLPLFGAMALATGFAGCGDKDKKGGDTLYDGLYVVGEATADQGVTARGYMLTALNENASNAPVTGLWEKYVALEGGKPFSIVKYAAGVETTYGVEGEWNTDTVTGANDQIGNVWKQDSKEGAWYEGDPYCFVRYANIASASTTKLTVPESGLYQVVVNESSNQVWILPVVWYFYNLQSRDETLFSNNERKLVAPDFNKEQMTYTLNDVAIKFVSFKLQNMQGWKYDLSKFGASNLSNVRIHCNLGLKDGETVIKYDGTENPVTRGGKDIPSGFAGLGVYNVSFTWKLSGGEPYTLKFNKTENIDFDPALQIPSVIGSMVDDWATDFDLAYDAAASTQTNSVYTNAQPIVFYAGKEFKIRLNHAWGTSYGYNSENIFGAGATNVSDAGGNIKVNTTAFYVVKFEINWETNAWKLTLN